MDNKTLNIKLLEGNINTAGIFPHLDRLKQSIRRIFIDEITAVEKWEQALKRMADRGRLNNILLVTTGSKARDLRRGAERLLGRKGKLPRTAWLFTPVSYAEFKKVCGGQLKQNTLYAYLLSGGSPIACASLASDGRIPEYSVEITRDWVEGEIALSGRNRTSLFNILHSLFRFAGTPIGQAKLARESGLANNTVAAGYIEILNDLGCVIPAYPWDSSRRILILRKECKYHFTNLLTAISYHPARIRTIDDFLQLTDQQQAPWFEWLIAQELQRRRAIKGDEILLPLAFWQNREHEIDFVESSDQFIEIKKGKANPLEFAWFHSCFPKEFLTVLTTSNIETPYLKSQTVEDFLLAS